jgi:hypothetical protein
MAKRTKMLARPLYRLEHRTHKVIPRHRFAMRMALAGAIWLGLTVFGLTIGMAGYAFFEGMSATDAYVNAAMILSGMGPLGFVLAPVFHRVLHRFHVEQTGEE